MKNDALKSEVVTLDNYVRDLRTRYFRAISAIYVYETLQELKAPNVVGENEAAENLKTLNFFKDFFQPTMESLRVFGLLELAKLFDNAKESLHINAVINYAKGNVTKLTRDDFVEFNSSERPSPTELLEHLESLDFADLQTMEKSLDANRTIIEKLTKYRNQYLAHDDKKKEEVIITHNDLRTLFQSVEEIFNLFSKRISSSFWSYDHIESGCKHHTKSVIEFLQRFEPYRIKEIEDEVQHRIESASRPDSFVEPE